MTCAISQKKKSGQIWGGAEVGQNWPHFDRL